MKKFLLKFLILFCFLVIIPAIHAISYDGPVFKERIPVDEESRSLYYRHDSVKWGGKKLAWGSFLSIRYRGQYNKSSPEVFVRDKTKRLISNNKVNKRR